MTSSSGFYQNHPSAVMTDDGNIHMIWEDSRDNGNILYSVLESGQSFMTDFSTVNDSATASHELAPKLTKDTDGHLYAIWVNRRYGKHIRFATTFPSDLANTQEALPSNFRLNEPYPNPFNSTTTISFSLEKAGIVSLRIFDLNGRLIDALAEKHMIPDTHEITWNASNYSSGVYIISLRGEGQSKSVKTLYLK